MRRGQSALEFMILFIVVYVLIFSLMSLFSERTAVARERGAYNEIIAIGTIVEQEVQLANRVRDNYVRKFELPKTVRGVPYQIRLEPVIAPQEVIVSTHGMSRVIFLPVQLKQNSILLPGSNWIHKDSTGISLTPKEPDITEPFYMGQSRDSPDEGTGER